MFFPGFVFFLGPAAKHLHHTFCPSSPKVHSLYVTKICYLLSGYRMSSFTQNRRTEYHYPILFPCRFSINSLESNFYLHYLKDFHGICVLFLFPFERMPPNIQSVQNVLTCTGRAPHWVPERSRYSTSSPVSIVALDCKSLLCFMLWAPLILKEYSASSFEPQRYLLTLIARLIL